MNIFFLGYMGCGKSFFSKKLAKLLSQESIDLDFQIEKKEKKTISEIFLNKGENYFRKRESMELNLILKNKKDFILASGGGTPCFLKNIELMNRFGLTIYLKKDPNSLYNLLINSNQKRPIFDSFETKDEFFNNFNKREKFYLKSKLIIECDFLSNSEILDQINNELNEYRFKK
tara:strand:+ start:308 stop:829 length:522 start_codon:yes stop_codon:yes gene_type:complete